MRPNSKKIIMYLHYILDYILAKFGKLKFSFGKIRPIKSAGKLTKALRS